ncbi:MAG: hypothetical protein KatS3mg131_0184 [Candidatus Tectimicrobiota bacterium]|nr:MAG: hypothetical protein KatS3mg131_0184 [Candidatus Tectomicrobia bacterium]
MRALKFVKHRLYGRGTVLETRHHGLELRVAFERGPEQWVRYEDVCSLEEEASPAPPAPAPSLSSAPSAARTLIEALRLGIVPHSHVAQFTVGRESEVAQIKSWLHDGPDGAFLLVGEYGAGKTHLLEYTRMLALHEGFAVALAALDANEAPLYRPKRVYQKLVASFGWGAPDGTCQDFRELLRAISRQSHDLLTHPYLGPVLEMLRRGDEDPERWAWIEGCESRCKPILYDHSTAANLYCHLLTALGWAVARRLGGKGLLLLFDEAEVVNMLVTRDQLARGENFVKGLVWACQSRPELLQEEGNLDGPQTRLRYHGHARVRFLYRSPSYTKAILAFTPTPALEVPYLKALPRMHLEPLPAAVWQSLFEQVVDLYRAAYGFALPSALQARVMARLRHSLPGTHQSLCQGRGGSPGSASLPRA